MSAMLIFYPDILALAEDLDPFCCIECGGDLHHSADPEAGWRKLQQYRKPSDMMLIALYSAAARKEISLERENMATLQLEPSADNIRFY